MTSVVGSRATSRAIQTAERRQSAPSPRRAIDLNGQWGFIPRDVSPADIALADKERITVPGLWKAQGRLNLDGPVWYVREVELDEITGNWTLSFGAVMDEADIYVNGAFLGKHVGAYTPFLFDVTGVLRAGRNEIAVRVLDPVAGSPDGEYRPATWKFNAGLGLLRAIVLG